MITLKIWDNSKYNVFAYDGVEETVLEQTQFKLQIRKYTIYDLIMKCN